METTFGIISYILTKFVRGVNMKANVKKRPAKRLKLIKTNNIKTAITEIIKILKTLNWIQDITKGGILSTLL
jgi:hypothetical protein